VILSHAAIRVKNDLCLTITRLEFPECHKAALKKELDGTFANDFASLISPKNTMQAEFCSLDSV